MVANLAAVSTGGPIWSFYGRRGLKEGLVLLKGMKDISQRLVPLFFFTKTILDVPIGCWCRTDSGVEHTPPLPLPPFFHTGFLQFVGLAQQRENNSRSRAVSSQWTTFQLLVLLFHLCPHIPDPWKRRKKSLRTNKSLKFSRNCALGWLQSRNNKAHM